MKLRRSILRNPKGVFFTTYGIEKGEIYQEFVFGNQIWKQTLCSSIKNHKNISNWDSFREHCIWLRFSCTSNLGKCVSLRIKIEIS